MAFERPFYQLISDPGGTGGGFVQHSGKGFFDLAFCDGVAGAFRSRGSWEVKDRFWWTGKVKKTVFESFTHVVWVRCPVNG